MDTSSAGGHHEGTKGGTRIVSAASIAIQLKKLYTTFRTPTFASFGTLNVRWSIVIRSMLRSQAFLHFLNAPGRLNQSPLILILRILVCFQALVILDTRDVAEMRVILLPNLQHCS